MTLPPQIYLASQSPRRRELLEQIGVRYQVITPEVPEHLADFESPGEYVIRLAIEKARAGWRLVAGQSLQLPVMGADTVVVLDGEVLGKPQDRSHGLAMLQRLSGRSHLVLTGMALTRGEQLITRLSVSHVSFRATTEAERAAYWASGEPADKAGGYGIQGRGAAFIQRLEGNYSGVMGLSLFDAAEMLGAFGIDFFDPEQ